jgi:hypothetical protein
LETIWKRLHGCAADCLARVPNGCLAKETEKHVAAGDR